MSKSNVFEGLSLSFATFGCGTIITTLLVRSAAGVRQLARSTAAFDSLKEIP
jgi:hypothetical protein